MKMLGKMTTFNVFPFNKLSTYRQNAQHQRYDSDIVERQLPGLLLNSRFVHGNGRIEEGKRLKRSNIPHELRPVEGPINIEQLPAMLAARYVKRYPYSQQDDPAIM